MDIDKIIDNRLQEFKTALILDLQFEANELQYLPKDECCQFHMAVIESIFRKLSERGIRV